MAELRVKMPDDDFEKLQKWADEESQTVQSYVIEKLFNRKNIFMAKETMNRELSKYTSGEQFTVPDCFLKKSGLV